MTRTRQTLVYFAMTFGITWGGVFAVMGTQGVLGVEPVPDERLPWVYLATLLGPATSGLLLTLVFDGWAGLRELGARLVRWRVAPWLHALALLTAPVLATATLLALSLRWPVYLPALVTADDRLGLVALGLVMGVVVALLEELGWTGFAIPRLRERFGVLGTGLIVGVSWGLWHAPLFLGTIDADGELSRVAYLAVLLFSFLVPFRVLMVWLYDRTGSVLLPVLTHAPLAAAQLLLIPADLSTPEVVIYDLLFAGCLWALVAVVLAKGQSQAPSAGTVPSTR